MKKITQVAETGGARLDFDDFRDVFNKEIWDALQAMLSPFDSDTEGVILSGCTISGGGPYNIAAGIVYLDGEFRRLPAQTGVSLPQYIKAATDVNTTRTFEDTVIKTLFITESADLATSAPGAGQYIAITSTSAPDSRRWGRPMFSSSATNVRKKATLDIGDWNMDATSNINVPHGLGAKWASIRVESVMIRNDAGTANYPIDTYINSVLTGEGAGGVGSVDNTNISLSRIAGYFFDSTDFNATSYNRGWIELTYEP